MYTEGDAHMKKRYTTKELMNYIEALSIRIENNQQAIYDLREELGLSAQIKKVFSRFFKSFKNKYLGASKKS
tara:strand:- start:59 stop:274 length:216 start_codon:yes stop_codon:yes gene_type:complete